MPSYSRGKKMYVIVYLCYILMILLFISIWFLSMWHLVQQVKMKLSNSWRITFVHLVGDPMALVFPRISHCQSTAIRQFRFLEMNYKATSLFIYQQQQTTRAYTFRISNHAVCEKGITNTTSALWNCRWKWAAAIMSGKDDQWQWSGWHLGKGEEMHTQLSVKSKKARSMNKYIDKEQNIELTGRRGEKCKWKKGGLQCCAVHTYTSHIRTLHYYLSLCYGGRGDEGVRDQKACCWWRK